MAVGDYNLTNINQTSSAFTYDSNGSIIFNELTMTDKYCSYKGRVQNVHITPTCYCLGDSAGRYCQLTNSEFLIIQNMHEIFLTKAEQTYMKYVSKVLNQNTEEENAFLSSLNSLILGNQLVAKEGTFLTKITDWLNRNVIYQINHCDLRYIEMVDNIYSSLISLTNTYKAGLIINKKGSDRDADLDIGQEEEIGGNIILVKKQIEYLTSLCFSETIDGLCSYRSKNILVDLLKIQI